MIGFLYKDIICSRIGWYLGSILLGFLLIVIAAPFIPEDLRGMVILLYLLVYFFVIHFLAISTMVRQILETDKGKSIEAYMLSLPVGKKGYIAAKYLLVFGMFVILMSGTMLSLVLAKGVSDETGLQKMAENIVPLLPAVTGILLTAAAIEMPFCLRFGVAAGQNIRTAILVILFFAGLVYLMFGNLEIFDWFNAETVWRYFEKHPKLLEQCKAGIPIGAVVFYILSGILSQLLYSQKQLGE